MYVTYCDLPDGNSLLFGVGSSINGNAQLLVHLGHRNSQNLSMEVSKASK